MTLPDTLANRYVSWLAVLAATWLLLASSTGLAAAPGASSPDRPRLGVVVQQVPFDRLHDLGLSHGVAVHRVVPGSAADAAGVEGGDILLRLAGKAIYSPARLQWLMGQMPVDETIALKLNRDGASKTVEVTLAPPSDTRARRTPDEPGIARLGISMTPLTPGLRQGYGVAPGKGVLVSDVEQDGPAGEAGLKAGDVLLQIDRRTIHGPMDVLRAVHFFDPGDEVNVSLMREGKEKTLEVTLGRAELGDRRRGHGRHPYGSPPYGSMPHRGSMPHGSMPPGYGHPVHPMYPMPMMPYFPGGQPYGEPRGETQGQTREETQGSSGAAEQTATSTSSADGDSGKAPAKSDGDGGGDKGGTESSGDGENI